MLKITEGKLHSSSFMAPALFFTKHFRLQVNTRTFLFWVSLCASVYVHTDLDFYCQCCFIHIKQIFFCSAAVVELELNVLIFRSTSVSELILLECVITSECVEEIPILL